MTGSFEEALARGESIVRGWLPEVDQCRRTMQPLEKLRIALQCGGSDAFSGVSANPLLGLVAKELVRHGGSANLAETDELIGAEPYVLSNVRDLETARAFLNKIERFQERASWHGETAEGNPSGGNNFRGLYNITVKSIGAARKKDPKLRLDYVIDYAQPMTAPGFYFMDSPGNDLEGIAGQVAAGCTMILFTTGNGSITNFPFVPTMKIMTNSGRYNMLAREMDVNAGRYLDGTPMETLAPETFELLVRLASGERSAGERVGYPQVQLWRDWPQTGPGHIDEVLGREKPTGRPLRAKALGDAPRLAAVTREQVGLLLPTSLCASQVARGIAQQLNGGTAGLDRFVALPHTEGCGVGGGISEQIYLRTMAGYLVHPFVSRALVLEHGCEKTHNDAMRNYIAEHAIDAEQFGWASIQLDGGLEKVTEKVRGFFATPANRGSPDAEPINVALVATENAPSSVGDAFARIASSVIASGGALVVPESFPAASDVFGAILDDTIKPTIGYGESGGTAGFHVMATPTRHFVETLTGLGATGVDLIIAYVGEQSRQGHPLVPMLQIGANEKVPDVDAFGDAKDLIGDIIALLPRVTTGDYRPKAFQTENTDFQMTRGLLGVSL
jgi:altronate dehydratase